MMPTAIITANPEGCITWCNAPAEKLFPTLAQGLTRGSRASTGRPTQPIQLEDLGSQLAGLVRDALAGEPTQEPFFMENRLAGGRTLVVRTRQLTGGGKCLGAVALVDDITDQIFADVQSEQLERTKFWRELAAGMSHEIRNPLVAIKTFTQLLPSRYSDAEFRNEFKEMVTRELGRLDGIVSQIEGFAHPTASVIDQADLTVLLQEAADGARAVTEVLEAQIKVQADADLPAWRGDRKAMTQCFQSFLYQWDEPAHDPTRTTNPSETTPLLDALLEPDAIGRVEARLRGVGHPPRSSDEMAEFLRNLGDLTTGELVGPMAGFVAELERSGLVTRIELSNVVDPERWVLTEDQPLYAAAFLASGECQPPGLDSTDHLGTQGADTPRSPASKKPLVPTKPKRRAKKSAEPIPSSLGTVANDEALATVLRRFLRNHALVGAADLLARYPIDSATATDLLDRFADEGNLVRLESGDGSDAPRWAERGNLDEVRRLSVAIRRRESVAVAPEVFADFVARWQHVHPSTRREGSLAVSLTIEQLQGFAGTADLWETEILPRRVRNYRPEWLDEALGRDQLDLAGRGTRRAGGRPSRGLCSARLRRSLANQR